jgi:hypothetical protein
MVARKIKRVFTYLPRLWRRYTSWTSFGLSRRAALRRAREDC